jgi:hypothetical protein
MVRVGSRHINVNWESRRAPESSPPVAEHRPTHYTLNVQPVWARVEKCPHRLCHEECSALENFKIDMGRVSEELRTLKCDVSFEPRDGTPTVLILNVGDDATTVDVKDAIQTVNMSIRKRISPAYTAFADMMATIRLAFEDRVADQRDTVLRDLDALSAAVNLNGSTLRCVVPGGIPVHTQAVTFVRARCNCVMRSPT